jgi:WD40 repeat protein
MRHKRSVFSASFSPEGRRIVTASHDGTARIWDALTGEPVSPPLMCRGQAWSAKFSPDGQKVVVASGSRAGVGQVRLWELPEAKEPVEEFILLAQLLSGTRLENTGALVPISPEELLQMWRAKANAVRLNPK